MSKTEVIGASLRAELHSVASANSQPKPDDGFVDLHDFVFGDGDGENLASLKLHYLTLGTPRRDVSDVIANGVLLLHGTAGSAADFAQAAFFDALYGAGEPLDLGRYFLVIPDAIGAGDSSKPSDGLGARFPHYLAGPRYWGHPDRVVGRGNHRPTVGWCASCTPLPATTLPQAPASTGPCSPLRRWRT
jgi:hypothetical protein